MKLHGLAVVVLLSIHGIFAQHTIHIYHPWAADTVRRDLPVHVVSPDMPPAFPGAAMTAEQRGLWFQWTWSDVQFRNPGQFHFVSYIPTPSNAAANPLYQYNGTAMFNTADLFPRGVTEVWIVPKDTGKATIYGYPPPIPKSKIAFIFNPWPSYAPMAKVHDDVAFARLPMSRDPKRCGWYRVDFPDSARTVQFKSSVGTYTYGPGGVGSTGKLDLTAGFAGADTLFILPEPIPKGAPKVLAAFPEGVVGQCQYPLTMTVRDFSSGHPDFEGGQAMGDALRQGMVAYNLDPSRKPVIGPTPHAGFQTLFNWFKDDSASAIEANRNFTACRDLPMSKAENGGWKYDSYNEPSHSFLPIDDFNRFGETSTSRYVDPQGVHRADPTAKPHNFHFCLEMHAEFTYEFGQTLVFAGDDDAWIYINNKLFLDFGGVHNSAIGKKNFDGLGLTQGSSYPFDFFHCERQTQLSHLSIETSAYLRQPPLLLVRQVAGPGGVVEYFLYQVVASKGQCTPEAGAGDTLPSPSQFQLRGPSTSSTVALPVGTSFGGITIDAGRSKVSIDTSRITGLEPGSYSVIYTSDQTGSISQILFTVSGPVSIGRSRGIVPTALQVFPAHAGGLAVQFLPGAGWNGNGSTELKLTSLQGTVVFRKTVSGAGAFTQTIPGTGLKRGVYLVVVESGTRRFSKRVVIQ